MESARNFRKIAKTRVGWSWEFLVEFRNFRKIAPQDTAEVFKSCYFICSLYHAALLCFRARVIVSIVCSFCPFVFLANPVYPSKSCAFAMQTIVAGPLGHKLCVRHA